MDINKMFSIIINYSACGLTESTEINFNFKVSVGQYQCMDVNPNGRKL